MKKNEICVTCQAEEVSLFECDECGELVCESCKIICDVCGSILCVECAVKDAAKNFVCPDCKEGA